MSTKPSELHVAFFPFMCAGHTIPMLDMVRLFAARDHLKITVITTPGNAPNIAKSLENCVMGASSTIDYHIIPFPSEQAGLPEGMENVNQHTPLDLSIKFVHSTNLLKHPLEQFFEESKPDCIIADFFFPFATDIAANYGVPRLFFRAVGVFAACAIAVIDEYKPQKSVLSDDEPFIIPTLPHTVSLTKSQMSSYVPEKGSFSSDCDEAALKSYGEVFNSFYELEPDYVDYHKNVLKRRCWHIGPVSLVNKKTNFRGATTLIGEHECLEWLDSKKNDSVVYICFGSTINFIGSQLKEIAMALESSGVDFIWVVNEQKGDGDDKEWLLDGFEERMKGKGLVVRGWAPQVLILEHRAVGGFVTHCGGNSFLEGVCAGVPMVTWPIFAEQFYNEKLITDILKIGVQVGSKQWTVSGRGTLVKHEQIEVALKEVMVGNEALEMRNRASKLKDLAKEALDEGGSSYNNLTCLIEELRSL